MLALHFNFSSASAMERRTDQDVDPSPAGHELERFRKYLQVLARMQVDPSRQRHFDISDLVQQTFLEAYQDLERFRGASDAELAAWLRQILARNLVDAQRALGRAKRDVARQRSLEEQLDRSSIHLGSWLAADQPSPSQQAQRHERAVRLAEALAELTEAQREALVLQYWHGWSLARIAEHLGRTPAAVAGLLHRGLKSLKAILREPG